MAKNTGRGRRTGALAVVSAARSTVTRMWTRRNTDPTRFRDLDEIRAQLDARADQDLTDRYEVVRAVTRYLDTMPSPVWGDRRMVTQEIVDMLFDPRPLADPRHTRASAQALLRLRGDVVPSPCGCGMRFCGWCMSGRPDYVPAGYRAVHAGRRR
jgi:hypothetical protein